MKSKPAGTMRPMTTGAGRKVLVGILDREVPAGASVVLLRDGEKYQLVVVTSDRGSDPASLASFLSPELVDASEMQHAAEEATR